MIRSCCSVLVLHGCVVALSCSPELHVLMAMLVRPISTHIFSNNLPAIRGKFGVAPLPYDPEYGGSSRGVLGGWNLAVSRYSDRPALAAKLATFLTSPAEEKFR